MGVQCSSAICSKDSIELLPLHLCGESIQHICVDYLYAFNWFLSPERKMVERKTLPLFLHHWGLTWKSFLASLGRTSHFSHPCDSVSVSAPPSQPLLSRLYPWRPQVPSSCLSSSSQLSEWTTQISDDTSDLWLTVDDKSESFMRGIPVGLRKRPSFL